LTDPPFSDIMMKEFKCTMQITVYSKLECPYCEKIKKVFNLMNLDFVEYKLDEHFTRQNFIDEFGEGSTFPRVIIDGNLIGGCTETIQHLKENNLL
jgi:glutaredoxin